MQKSEIESTAKAGTRVIIAASAGIIGGIITGTITAWKYALLSAWDIAAITFLLWMWLTLHGRSAEQTAQLATREDPGHAYSDIVLVFASVASLAAVAAILLQLGKTTGMPGYIQDLLSIGSVIISWTTVHVVYTLRYAREYYKDKGCISFNDDHQPRYSDFAYMAFTVGMTFQVSDTNIKSNKIRRIILRHALLSYMFGTVIVALTINLLAGLGK